MILTFTPPESHEFDSFYGGYVSRVAHVAAPLDELAVQRRRIVDLLGSAPSDRAAYRYAPGKWTIADLVCQRG